MVLFLCPVGGSVTKWKSIELGAGWGLGEGGQTTMILKLGSLYVSLKNVTSPLGAPFDMAE